MRLLNLKFMKNNTDYYKLSIQNSNDSIISLGFERSKTITYTKFSAFYLFKGNLAKSFNVLPPPISYIYTI